MSPPLRRALHPLPVAMHLDMRTFPSPSPLYAQPRATRFVIFAITIIGTTTAAATTAVSSTDAAIVSIHHKVRQQGRYVRR